MSSEQKTITTYGQRWVLWQILCCVLGGLFYAKYALLDSAFSFSSLIVTLVFVAMIVGKLPAATSYLRFMQKLARPVAKVIGRKEFETVTNQSQQQGDRWLGFGFPWEASHCQQVKEFSSIDWRATFESAMDSAVSRRYLKENWLQCLLHPIDSLEAIGQQQSRVAQAPGFPWIHLLDEEKPFYVTQSDLAGHMLVVGTTGAGKSRFLEHQITQAILKGDTVIVLDPKGDKALEANMLEACRLTGKEDRFVRIHLGDPEKSHGIDLLANYSRVGELASRIADTLPGQSGEGQVFVDMGRSILRTLLEGLELVGERPTFKRLHHSFLHRAELAERALRTYLSAQLGEERIAKETQGKGFMASYKALKELYQRGTAYDARIESLISLADRDPENLMKISVSTINLLENLVRGDLGEMLTPWSESGVQLRPFTDTKSLVSRNSVLYVGLDALSDSQLASSIGSMFLSDLAATAGSRYNFDDSPSPVSLFVDEAAELMCEPFVQMLNKSRGAGFSICLATQTVADFVAKAGNKQAEAMRVLANLNNFVALRCNDQETQEFVVNRVPKTQIESTMFSHNVAVSADHLTTQAGSLGERSQMIEADLVPAQLLGALPNFEFFAVVAGGHVMKGRIPILDLQANEGK
ncbi:MAG: conjugative transfer system coupling protein TraD [Burkholderiaceae bacterium]|nr:conjugative transfer system coupling protein TraD [Burkholderiaceae bacterium]